MRELKTQHNERSLPTQTLVGAKGEPDPNPSRQRGQQDRDVTTLDRVIHIGTAHTRSINLTRDADAPDLIFINTSHARDEDVRRPHE